MQALSNLCMLEEPTMLIRLQNRAIPRYTTAECNAILSISEIFMQNRIIFINH